MADHTFQLNVVTPDRVVLDEPAISLVAPGVEGYLGILANHAPLMTEIGVGELRFTNADRREVRLAISGGFLQVADNKVTILADTAERASEIDVDRARLALSRANEERNALVSLENRTQLREIDAARERAENRLRVAGAGR